MSLSIKKNRFEIFGESNLHHSILIKAFFENIVEDIRAELEEKLNMKLRGNPDYSESIFETFTIDDARNLSERAQNTPIILDGRKVFVISLKNMPFEAQNALLRLFEEPPKHTHFILISPNISFFLPTLISRFEVREFLSESDNAVGGAKKFLKLTLKEKLDFVDELVDEIKDEKKTKSDAINFVSDLEKEMQKILLSKKSKEIIFFVNELLNAKKNLYSRSPSIKLTLEHLSLVSPTI